MLLMACSSTPRYNTYNSGYSTPAYRPQTTTTYVNPYNAQKPATHSAASTTKAPVVSNFVRLSYEDLVKFEPNCEERVEQTALLEEQLRRNHFYTVSGVEGNATQGKISKSYYSLAKYRIWSLRFACQGTEVSRNIVQDELLATPNQPPASTPRCYFEETAEVKTGLHSASYLASDHKGTRKEICTNFPYVVDRPVIRIGDQMSFSARDLRGGASTASLRKWKGNIYQMVSKTEMHLNQAVRFTLVTVRSGVNQWTVVDKF
jgi:hypothetical protein